MKKIMGIFLLLLVPLSAYAQEPITGLTITAEPTTLSVGETQDGFLVVEWTGTKPLIIDQVLLNEENLPIELEFDLPIILAPEPDENGVSTSKIPYKITASSVKCDEKILTDCIIPDSRYSIPLEIVGTDELGRLRGNALLQVDITTGYEVAQLTNLMLGALALVGIVAFIVRKKKK